MNHEHVKIAVTDSIKSGVEYVPANRMHEECWELIRSPLYATQVAAGDVIRVLDCETGSFEVVHRGGNVSVQFYLRPNDADNFDATTAVAKEIESELRVLDGRMDGMTAGLIVFSIPCKVGFAAIEKVFEDVAHRHIGAKWQYGNVYDPVTEEPLLWWE